MAAPTAPAVVAAPAATSAPTAVHYLQLGTYRQRDSAEADQARLAAQGIETTLRQRGGYYVLRLPPFPSRQAAEAEESRLRNLAIDCVYVGPPR
ncbi:MAG: SPOR domain-containing protein [Deltaproteobacteria bacterium]|nr:SPOR domain-containing protein [Deltaproteobacteria bacterium]NCP96643.1 SPOR domain-containing protein [Deltaproteobacteria bacterium]NCS72972.1 SPOR domain-containing protein [Deltaproteobacteria bacterium]PIW82515.1 MAG: hypothetical protein COZ96_08210 [Nitrospirae bacterium CG_4_8_14_3_um_filter_70_85]